MDATQTDDPVPETAPAAADLETRSENTESLSGLEINLGDFTRTQGLMKSLRLTLNGNIAVAVEDLASGVGEAGRKFKMGDIEQANIDVTRLYSAFGQRTNQWESQARGLEQQMKMQAAKNPKSISIDTMNRMKTEQTAVRTRIRTAEVNFRRLHQGLDQAFTNLQRTPAATSETAAALPPGFLAALKTAEIADRPAIVNEFFEIDSELKVSVSRGAQGGYDIKFDPKPPLGRVYFLTQSAQIVRLEQLGDAVLLQDLITDKPIEMKLSEFVRHVQSGAWLLRPRSV